MHRTLLLTLILTLAACDGALRDPTGLGTGGGNGGTIVGGGGGGSGGSVLLGSWQTVFVFRLTTDVQRHTVTWSFHSNGSCRRVIAIYSVLEDRTLTSSVDCAFRSGGGDVAITFEGNSSPVSFRWSLEHFPPIVSSSMASPTTDWTDPVLRMPLHETDIDVLVIGAGPAGSATAYWLARAGHRVVLLDRSDFPRDKACSEYLGPGAADMLERIGILDEVRRAGANPLTGTTVITAGGPRLTGRFSLASTQRPDAEGLSLTRRLLDDVLLRTAIRAGADFVPRSTVEDLVIEGGLVRGARLREAGGGHRTIRARLTVGADGLRSVVARRLGGVRVSSPRRMAFVAHVRGVTGLATSAEMHVGPAGYVGLNPLGDNLTNVALVIRSDRMDEVQGQPEDFLFTALATYPRLAGRIPRSGVVRPVIATGPFSVRARRVVTDGALLVGDAADFFDPFTGEGIFSALRGAELAASVAEHGLTRPGPVLARHLIAYPRERRRAFLGKWAVERLIGYGMLAPALFERAVARLGRRGSMAHTLIGVTADFVPAARVLNPLFLSRMII